MSGNLSSSGSEPSIAPAPSGGRWRALCRLVAVALHIVRGLCIVYLRLPGMSRQQRHAQVQQWSAELVRRCGVSLQVCGQLASPSNGAGLLLVANHISWLDIEALHAVCFCRFVAKSEVGQWPVVGTLANSAETIYLQRTSRRDTVRVLDGISSSLRAMWWQSFPKAPPATGARCCPFTPTCCKRRLMPMQPCSP